MRDDYNELHVDIYRPWLELAKAIGRKYGPTIPHQAVELGDINEGWHALLNAGDEQHGNLQPLEAGLHWYGFPAGIITMHGGLIAGGARANEDTFIQWCKEIEP